MRDPAVRSMRVRAEPILLAVLAIALLLRLIAIGGGLSNDEGYTWLVASAHAPGAFLDRLAAFENTPPLYYLLTWPLPDGGVAWLRLVSVLAGVGCVVATYWIAIAADADRAASRRRAALFAAAGVAVAPFAVSYSDFARGFILADFLLLVALGAALRRRWWLYAIAGAAAVYSEYDAALVLIALSAALVLDRRHRDALLALAPIALLALWLPEALRHSTTKVSPVYPNPSPDSLRDAVVRLTFGEHGTAHASGLRWLQFAVVGAVVVWAFRKAPRWLTVVAGGTLVLHALVHWIGPDVFAARYMTELIPLVAIALGYALAQSRRELQLAAVVAVGLLAIAVGVRRGEADNQPNIAALGRLVAPAAAHRTVVTNSAVVAYYLRGLHPRLDRPFGLGPGLEAGCVASCKQGFLIVDDTRVAGGIRTGPGPSHQFGPLYVRATPQEGTSASVDPEGQMNSLICSIALLVASGLGGIGTPHPMEVTVQDDALFLHQPPLAVQRTAKRLAALGADRIRLTAGWSVLAPSPTARKQPRRFDPTNSAQYQQGPFRALDTAVKAATNAGLNVQIDIAFWAPRWAVARGLANSTRQRYAPNAVKFAQFALAVARRYNGGFPDPTSRKGKPLPAVRLWTPWNEPNHPSFLLPQSLRTRSGWRDVAPDIYRAMYESAYAALKRVNPQNQVLLGGLSSRGAAHPGPDRNIPPLRFLRELACVGPDLRPLRDPACHNYQPLQADGFAYHPYSFEAAPNVIYGGPDTVHLSDLGRLSDLLGQLHSAGRITTDLPIYLTEFGYETNPPDTRRGVPPETQARYLSLAAFLAWMNPDTRMFAQFLLQDIADPRSYQTGLLYSDGRPKPALQAFELPFWAQAQESGAQPYVLVWGQVRPGHGPQTVALQEQHADGTWRTIKSIASPSQPDGKTCPTQDNQFLTDENGFYLRLVPYDGLSAYRGAWARPDGGTSYTQPVTVGLPLPAKTA